MPSKEGKPSFLDLPSELRNQIYENVISSLPRASESFHELSKPFFHGGILILDTTHRPRLIRPAMIGTCRQIHHELLSYIYSHHIIHCTPETALTFYWNGAATRIRRINLVQLADDSIDRPFWRATAPVEVSVSRDKADVNQQSVKSRSEWEVVLEDPNVCFCEIAAIVESAVSTLDFTRNFHRIAASPSQLAKMRRITGCPFKSHYLLAESIQYIPMQPMPNTPALPSRKTAKSQVQNTLAQPKITSSGLESILGAQEARPRLGPATAPVSYRHEMRRWLRESIVSWRRFAPNPGKFVRRGEMAGR